MEWTWPEFRKSLRDTGGEFSLKNWPSIMRAGRKNSNPFIPTMGCQFEQLKSSGEQ